MPAKILPISSTPIGHRLRSSKAAVPDVPVSVPLDDPALVVGLTLALAGQGHGAAAAIPSVLLDRLRHHAWSGDPTCRLALDWLMQKTAARCDRAVAGDHHCAVPHVDLAEIVSASSIDTLEGI